MLSDKAKQVASIMCAHPVEKVSDLSPDEIELIIEGYALRVWDFIYANRISVN